MTRDYVIDSNVLFSAFISGREIYKILFAGHRIYLPDFAFVEIEKYKQRILKKTKLGEVEFHEFVLRLLRDITVIPALVISQDALDHAYGLCKEIDEKDTVYVAAAIQLEATLITNDRALLGGLKERGFPHVVLLRDFVEDRLDQGNAPGSGAAG